MNGQVDTGCRLTISSNHTSSQLEFGSWLWCCWAVRPRVLWCLSLNLSFPIGNVGTTVSPRWGCWGREGRLCGANSDTGLGTQGHRPTDADHWCPACPAGPALPPHLPSPCAGPGSCRPPPGPPRVSCLRTQLGVSTSPARAEYGRLTHGGGNHMCHISQSHGPAPTRCRTTKPCSSLKFPF